MVKIQIFYYFVAISIMSSCLARQIIKLQKCHMSVFENNTNVCCSAEDIIH